MHPQAKSLKETWDVRKFKCFIKKLEMKIKITVQVQPFDNIEKWLKSQRKMGP